MEQVGGQHFFALALLVTLGAPAIIAIWCFVAAFVYETYRYMKDDR
jgi:hypothetical protein